MLKIGLTGNYYSGQNDVEKIFSKLDVKVFDADLVLKYLLFFSKKHKDEIKSTYGKNIYNLGLLDLSKFNTTKKWDDLLNLIEFDILKAYETFRKKNKEDFYTIFKYNFLFERGFHLNMDFNINCFKPKDFRKSDITFFTPLDEYTIDKILDSEYNEYEKNKKSDYVIENYSKSVNPNLEDNVLKIHSKILKKKPQLNNFNLGSREVGELWY